MKSIKSMAVVCVLVLLLGIQVNAAEGDNQEQRLSQYASLAVGGVDIVSGGEVTGDVPEGVAYNVEENVLTLTDYSYEVGVGATMYDVEAGISALAMGDDFTIRLVGENTISAASEYATILVATEGVIEGPGTLNVLNVASEGIGYTNLTIDGCTVNITSGPWDYTTYGIMGNPSREGELVLKNSTVNISSSKPSGSWTAHFGIDTQAGNLTVENSEVNVEVTNGNAFGIGVGRTLSGETLGGRLTVEDSVIKCIGNTDMYVNESTEVNWPMYFYNISSTEELNYYTVDGTSFVRSEFDKIFEQNSSGRYGINESVIISSYPLAEYCNHQWDEGTVKAEATCEEKGEMIYTCTLCGETKTEEIQALGHDWSEWEVLKEAGCTEPGVQSRECARCKKIENEDIPALGHDYVTTIIKEATCTEDGVKQDKCSRCGDVSSETAIPAIGHSYGEWTVVKEPTFHEDGEEARTCTACGDVDTRVIPKLSESHTHDYSGMEEIIKEATCTAEGRKKVYCTEPECGAFVEEVIPMKEHTPGEWEIVKEATCAERGIMQKTCTVCGTVIETQEIEKLPHTYGEWEIVTEPTCTESGVESAVCEVCGETTVRAVEALGHDFKEWEVVTPATCTEKGEEISICTRCQERGTREIEATGHAFGEWEVTKEPTFTEEGQKEAVCEVCGEVKTEAIPKLSGGQSAGTDENDKVNGTQNQKEAEEGVPQTGDESPIAFCIVALIFAAGIVLVVRKRYSR